MVMFVAEGVSASWSSEVGIAREWGEEKASLHCLLHRGLRSFISLMFCMVTMFAHGNELPAGFSDVYDHHCWDLD